MSKSSKIFLGIITFIPFVFFAIYMSIFFRFFYDVLLYHRSTPEDVFFELLPSFVFLALLIIAKLGLLIYYIVHVVNNQRIDSTERIVWILVFIFVGMIGYPIYWYVRIWKEGGSIPPTLAKQ